MFKGIKDNWKKAEAAAVIEAALTDMRQAGTYDRDPAKGANAIVQKAWETQPEIFDGRSGVRPHKLTVAIVSMSMMVENMNPESDYFTPFMVSLGVMLQGAAANATQLGFTRTDEHLIEQVAGIYERLSAVHLSDELSAEIASMTNHRW